PPPPPGPGGGAPPGPPGRRRRRAGRRLLRGGLRHPLAGDRRRPRPRLGGRVAAGWDADRYQRQFGYVSAFGGDVLELLDPAPGEPVLDLGCGTGELAAAIAATGARVLALDSDPAMVAAARRPLARGPGPVAHRHDT